jgi:tetratricopeptide (TPR) repeat protein
LPGHWNGELSVAGAEARVEYVRTLWNGVQQAVENGQSLTDVQAGYRLDEAFPELVGSPGFSPQMNYASISEIWKEVTGQTSAARALFAVLIEGADEAAIAEILADRGSESPHYLFTEAEINGYGYALLQQGQVDSAIRMFRINVELFPDSWNVYDSLGEALLGADQPDEAAAMYERSLALNPDNTNGREILDRIRAAPATAERTRES